MNHNHGNGDRAAPAGLRAWLSRHGLVLAGFVLIAGYFLWAEHKAHILAFSAWLPWLLLLLCPLMHLFMHHGHGSHGSSHEDERGDEK
ncbi:DUF2933 domain-containing protein [Thalassospiraceae bacterium LMO-JJ14]|nr:DUF2933 domain-containing protein [Thalassospiraceae bacterium LMO-JJ14]